VCTNSTKSNGTNNLSRTACEFLYSTNQTGMKSTVTSIALSYATSKVGSLYRKRMKAEVETHDKNIFEKRSESQLIKLPKQCPGKLDGIYISQVLAFSQTPAETHS